MTDQQYARATELRGKITEAREDLRNAREWREVSEAEGARVSLETSSPGLPHRLLLYPAPGSLVAWIDAYCEMLNQRLLALETEYAAL